MTAPVPVLEDLPDPSGKTVLVRCDLNVPMSGTEITDDLRIRAALPTLQWLIGKGATLKVCSHLGRPKGTRDPQYDIAPIRACLLELLGSRAAKVEVVDNLRWSPGEEANDPAFVDQLCQGIDLYVDDAFGAAHRAHASIVGPPAKGIPSAAGRLLAKEVEVLGGLLDGPRRPFLAILGGSKVSDKLAVINAMLSKVDDLIVGGGMAFTFLKALGHEVGGSLLQDDMVAECAALLARSGKDGQGTIHLPEDIVALSPDGVIMDPSGGGDVRTFGRSLAAGWKGLDIGPGTAAVFGDLIAEAGTVLWNGPMGVFEDPRFAAGTKHVAQALADARGFTVVGGGDSAAAIAQFGLAGDVDWVSTGGGASLELLEQGDLPGLIALRGKS